MSKGREKRTNVGSFGHLGQTCPTRVHFSCVALRSVTMYLILVTWHVITYLLSHVTLLSVSCLLSSVFVVARIMSGCM